jgi:hypothetical protein
VLKIFIFIHYFLLVFHLHFLRGYVWIMRMRWSKLGIIYVCMSILPREQFKAIWTKILSTLLAIEPQVTNPQDPYQHRNMGFLAERLHSSALFYAERNGACLQRARVVQVG